MRQLLAAPVGRRGEAIPAGRGPGGVGVLPAGRRRDVAVLEWCTELVAHAVERRDHVAGEATGFLQHRIDRFLVEIAVKALGDGRFQAGSVLKGESDVGDRRAVGHSG